MAVKMTALAPTPSASVRNTTTVKPGVADQHANRISQVASKIAKHVHAPALCDRLGMRGVPAIDDERRQGTSGRLDVSRQRRVISRYRRGGTRQGVFVRRSSRARFLVEIAQVFRQLVDDFRLARQRQRRESFPHVLAEVHVSPDRIDAGDALQRFEQLAPARSLLGQHPPP